MIVKLLLITFLISLAVSWLVVLFFGKPIREILRRIIADEISSVWSRYLNFAMLVVGISSGVRVWDFEKYLEPLANGTHVVLNRERWIIDIYRTIIGTLQGIAWMLLIFFIFALIAFVIVRIFEMKNERTRADS